MLVLENPNKMARDLTAPDRIAYLPAQELDGPCGDPADCVEENYRPRSHFHQPTSKRRILGVF